MSKLCCSCGARTCCRERFCDCCIPWPAMSGVYGLRGNEASSLRAARDRLTYQNRVFASDCCVESRKSRWRKDAIMLHSSLDISETNVHPVANISQILRRKLQRSHRFESNKRSPALVQLDICGDRV